MPWPASGGETVGSAERDRRLGELMRLTRQLLDADVALLSQVTDDREVLTLTSGEWPGVGTLQGHSAPLRDTVCGRMLEGRIGTIVVDARREPATADLPTVRTLGLGSWMGVPIQVDDGELFVLCCLTRDARPSLGPREAKLLSGLAESVRAELLTPALVPG